MGLLVLLRSRLGSWTSERRTGARSRAAHCCIASRRFLSYDRGMLVGRDAQCLWIEHLLADARAGRSSALVIRGEPGIGKSALLRHAVATSADMQVLTVGGVESESEFAFLGLADLVRPVSAELRRLPEPMSVALAGALAVGPPSGADRFTVYIAVLSLLSLIAKRRPVLIAVDDFQWVDAASQEALVCVARRLGTEGILILLAVREVEGAVTGAWQLPVMDLPGLDRRSAEILLRRSVSERDIVEHVAGHLVDSALGNPLALLEIPPLLSDEQLAGSEPLPDPLPVGPSLERVFLPRLAALPEQLRRTLLVAAANDQADSVAIAGALERLGLSPDMLEASESAGLVNLDGLEVQFRHPILRAVVYHSATAADRRAAHRALAVSLRAAGAADRAAWHQAAAAVVPDETVAGLLEQAAVLAQGRGGQIAAARALERAALLTPDPREKARRLLAAAGAAYPGGRVAWARALLETAEKSTQDPLLRADIAHLRGRVEMWRGPAAFARRLLANEAAMVEPADPGRAAIMLADAAMACIMVGSIKLAVQTARLACDSARRSCDAGILGVTTTLEGIARSFMGEARSAYPAIRASLPDNRGIALPSYLAPMVAQVAVWAEDYRGARQVLEGIVNRAHRTGALGEISFPLAVLADAQFRAGAWADAYATANEAVRLGADTGQESALSFGLVQLARIEAARGLEDQCRQHVREALELAEPRGGFAVHFFAAAALGLLELGLGRFAVAGEAMSWLAAVAEAGGLREPAIVPWLPDAIEAAARARNHTEAARLLSCLDEQAAAAPGRWAAAAAARCRGILAGESAYQEAFADALGRHGIAPSFERARTELCLGERLRRSKRRKEADGWLRAAADTFARLGAAPWADRARAELEAAGARPTSTAALGASRARMAHPGTPDDGGAGFAHAGTLATRLTAQELQIALAIANGATNREAGIALFLSEKTIETHLSSVYRKLGVRRRAELAALCASERLTPLSR
jgi:DNA-binding CsgD family transcriptional regulator/tetratricopeptide (TPR) repeat protein